jgi:hypothetical protein
MNNLTTIASAQRCPDAFGALRTYRADRADFFGIFGSRRLGADAGNSKVGTCHRMSSKSSLFATPRVSLRAPPGVSASRGSTRMARLDPFRSSSSALSTQGRDAQCRARQILQSG